MNPRILAKGLDAFVDGHVTFNLADILSTSYGEEFGNVNTLSVASKTWDEIQIETRELMQLYYEDLKLKVEAAREGQTLEGQ